MTTRLPDIRRATEELDELRRELRGLEKRIDALTAWLQKAKAELPEVENRSFSVVQEAAIASRIADAVLSSLQTAPQISTPRNIREREAAKYLGVSVSALRAWRMRSKGPRFIHLGRMVLYPVKELDAYVKAAWVPRRV
jgi:predicted DNA-binding transcriptional regulator AlpA